MPKGISQTAQTLAGCLWTSSSRESANSGRRLANMDVFGYFCTDLNYVP